MKKINTFKLATALMVLTTFGFARAQSDSSFTLQQCIDYALKNSTSIKNSDLDIAIAKAKVGEIRSIGLPQINGTAQVVDNPTLQRMFLISGAFFPIPGVPAGETAAIPNLFQLRTSGDVSATASQLIFNGSYFIGLKAARTYVELSEKSANLNKAQIVENVSKAFYMVIINRERTAILDANVARLDTLVKQTKAMQQQGFVEKIDADRLEVAYNNLLTERENFKNIIELSTLLLKFQMGYDVNKSINVNGSIEDLKKAETLTTGAKVDYNNRPEYQLLLTQKNLERYNLKNIRAGYLPTLSAFGSIGVVRMDQNISEVFSNTWYDYNRWGITLNIPIFDGFDKCYKAKQSKLNLQKIDNNIGDFERVADMQTQQAEITLKNNIKSLDIQSKNLELAKEVSRVSKVKYEQGVGSNLEVVDAETSLKTAQTNYYNALYDLMVAQLDYQKSLGTLYNQK